MHPLPRAAYDVLCTDAQLLSSVLRTFNDFTPWIRGSGTPFFPEYTDHSDEQVSRTLRTAVELVRQEA